MGAVGKSKGSNLIYNVDNERFNSYNYREVQKTSMKDAIGDVREAIDKIMADSWMEKDTDHLYEALADWFPRSMEGDEAEKVIRVDEKNQYITTVDIRLWENREGKIEATLEPHSYHFDEFTDKELEEMGIERRR